uniref:Sperm-tail PG-rich repeat containing 4 n=1 Tax=Hippocampus comes TaxID=109280 RepID=A0A3Q2Z2Y2_HIPCM
GPTPLYCAQGLFWQGDIGNLSAGCHLATPLDTSMTGLDRIRELIEESDVNPIRKSCGFKGTDRERQPMGLKTGELQSVSSPNFSFLLSFPSPSTKIEEKSPLCSFVFSLLSVHHCSFFFFFYDSPIVHFLLRRHAIFRSSVQRIPFPPKEGPAPGAYTLSSKPADGITSCFKSKLPRLHSVHSVTPGPGAYEPHWKWLDNLTLKTTVEPSFSLLFRNTP